MIFLCSLKIFDTEGGQLLPGTNQVTHVSNSHFINTTCMSFPNDRVAHNFLHLAALLQSFSMLLVSEMCGTFRDVFSFHGGIKRDEVCTGKSPGHPFLSSPFVDTKLKLTKGFTPMIS